MQKKCAPINCLHLPEGIKQILFYEFNFVLEKEGLRYEVSTV